MSGVTEHLNSERTGDFFSLIAEGQYLGALLNLSRDKCDHEVLSLGVFGPESGFELIPAQSKSGYLNKEIQLHCTRAEFRLAL